MIRRTDAPTVYGSSSPFPAQALGVGAYVKKPYVIEKLGLAVRNELERSA
ncbi:MAG: hypothetical protein NTV58_15475 [Deltaproteobacteria bacterium]|nr:hypothetical protein [Deltaproteobacteria bacterium]